MLWPWNRHVCFDMFPVNCRSINALKQAPDWYNKRSTYLDLKTADWTREISRMMMYLRAFCKLNYFVKKYWCCFCVNSNSRGIIWVWEGQALEIFIFAIQSIIKGWRAIQFLSALNFNVALGPATSVKQTLTMNYNWFMVMFGSTDSHSK